jgi:uncharacterized repeat protein (TIGR01451 family)
MPFLNTPNPGGVYKAWITPVQAYVAKGGKLDAQTNAVKSTGTVVGYARDAGFSAPLSRVKTDNFKVKENPPFIQVRKYTDVNKDGTLDAGDTEYTGWPVTVTETVDGGTVTNEYLTPTENIAVPHNSTVTVCEAGVEDWKFSFALVNGAPAAVTTTTIDGKTFYCVDVTVGSGPSTVTIAFGNIKLVPKLEVAKTPSSQTVTSGESIVWGIKVSNTGDGKATGVVVTDVLPSLVGGTYSPVPAGCTLSGFNLSCSVGDLAAGASRSFVVTLQTTLGQGCSVVKNTANASGNGGLSAVSQEVSATVTGCGGVFTPGYWKNHPEAQVLPQLLGNFSVGTNAMAKSVFDGMNCSSSSDQDAIGCLAGHLLAAKFNFANGGVQPQCAKAAVVAADAILAGLPYIGPTGTYGPLSASLRASAISTKDVLDGYNNSINGLTCTGGS